MVKKAISDAPVASKAGGYGVTPYLVISVTLSAEDRRKFTDIIQLNYVSSVLLKYVADYML